MRGDSPVIASARPEDDRLRAKPFLKWAGGKRGLLEDLLPLVPSLEKGSTYYEPFLGGGAVFFALRPKRAVLSDLNGELIETFRTVRDDPRRVIRSLAQLRYSKDSYYRIRSKLPPTRWQRAARFIYLNKTGFNGLFRVNFAGRFNVPFGNHGSNLMVCDSKQVLTASAALEGITLLRSDFENTVARASAGDLVYFDPPYTTAHTNNGFVEYNAKVFKLEDQTRLAKVAKDLAHRNVKVAVSNADHSSIRSLYADDCFKIDRIERWSTIAGKATKRFLTSEILITSREDIG